MIVKNRQKIIYKLKSGEGILYQMVEDPSNPVRRVKTLSKSELKQNN